MTFYNLMISIFTYKSNYKDQSCAHFLEANKQRGIQVGLKCENEYIPIFEYILSFKDSSSYLEIGKSMQKIKL